MCVCVCVCVCAVLATCLLIACLNTLFCLLVLSGTLPLTIGGEGGVRSGARWGGWRGAGVGIEVSISRFGSPSHLFEQCLPPAAPVIEIGHGGMCQGHRVHNGGFSQWIISYSLMPNSSALICSSYIHRFYFILFHFIFMHLSRQRFFALRTAMLRHHKAAAAWWPPKGNSFRASVCVCFEHCRAVCISIAT